MEEIKEDHNKGIVKKLIILNCSLFLAPEKNPKGWKEKSWKDTKKNIDDKEDLDRIYKALEKNKCSL